MPRLSPQCTPGPHQPPTFSSLHCTYFQRPPPPLGRILCLSQAFALHRAQTHLTTALLHSNALPTALPCSNPPPTAFPCSNEALPLSHARTHPQPPSCA